MPALDISETDRERHISYTPGRSVCDILATTDMRVPTACGGIGICGLCRVRVDKGAVNDPTVGELNMISEDELRQGIRLACQLKPIEDVRITIESLPVPIWRSLAEDEYSQVVFPAQTIPGSTRTRNPYAVAVDLGTTQIRVSLWNVEKRLRLAGRTGLNPQMSFGADVLTRLAVAADSEKRARELAWLARGAIGEALLDISEKTGCDRQAIGRMVIVGNTAMLSLLSEKNSPLLLQPDYWTRAMDCAPEDTSSWKIAWGMEPNAQVEIIPPLAGFVGSDFLAAVLTTQLTRGPAGSLLIDFGTNSEIGLWDGSTLWVTSAAGGPAFEGSGISCGMPADPGAICKIERSNSAREFRFDVIGGGEAKGFCGSGLVDLFASLIEAGTLDRKGKFTRDVGEAGLLIQKEPRTIALKKRDIDVYQRAQAAIAAGIACLLEKGNIRPTHLQRICVCGAFGRFLNIAHAQAIGLLPEIAPERVELYGNAALAGCESWLFFNDRSIILESLRTKARVVNLSQVPEFEERFIQGLYLQPMQVEAQPTPRHPSVT